MTVPVRRTPFLQQTRNFTDETVLPEVLTKTYSEIAFAVNERTIGIYDKFMLVNGNQWFNNEEPTKRRQAYRQTYEFENVTASIAEPHGLENIDMVVRIFGTAETATDFIPLPYVGDPISDSIDLHVSKPAGIIPGNIVIDFGTTSPTLIRAFVTLEFLLKTT